MKLRLICLSIWIFHIIGPLVLFINLIESVENGKKFEVFSLIGEISFKVPVIWTYLFMTWVISLAMSEKLKSWRLRLEVDKRAHIIRSIRLAYVEARNNMNDMDNKLKFASS